MSATFRARWAEEERLSPLDRLAQQMGRTEERRAASGFVQGPWPVAENVTTTEPLQQDNRVDGRVAVQAETATVSSENPAADYARLLQERIAAAKEITERGQGPERPVSSGQDDEAPARKPHLSLIARIVGDYLELCYNPAQNWLRWIAEDLRDRAAARRNLFGNNEGRGDASDPIAWTKPQGFAATHCMNCRAGWTRTAEAGTLIACLLDREQVPAAMIHCDRYEADPDRKRPEP